MTGLIALHRPKWARPDLVALRRVEAFVSINQRGLTLLACHHVSLHVGVATVTLRSLAWGSAHLMSGIDWP